MIFDRAAALILLIPLALLILAAARRSRSPLAPARRRWSAAARLALAALLVLALASPRLEVGRPSPRPVVYLVDVSDSVPLPDREAVLRRIAAIGREGGAATEPWVIAFAGGAKAHRLEDPAGAERDDALRELLLFPAVEAEARRDLERAAAQPASGSSRRDAAEATFRRIARLRQELDPTETDLLAAVRALNGCPAGGRSPAVFLFTDGRLTRPFAPADWASLRDAASSLTVADVGGTEPDLEVASLTAPAAVDAGQPFDAILRLQAHGGEAVSIRLLIDDRPQGDTPLACAPGPNTVTLPRLRIEESGLHRLKVIVNAPGDPEPRNNVGIALVRVGAPPEVLLVEGRRGLAAHLQSALEVQGIRAERIEADRFPARREVLARFGAVACVGLAADQFPAGAPDALRAAVEDEGVGLLFCGGPQLAGAKSWRGHPAERLLPVAFEPYDPAPPAGGAGTPAAPGGPPSPAAPPKPAAVESTSITLYLLIDKSGSMAGDNIRLAKEAAIAAAETLEDGDFVGVIAFDVEPKLVLETTSAARMDHIRDRIARIQPDGGTNVYPALLMAYRLLRDDRSQARHVILLSDGVTQLADFQALLNPMRAARITVSTVCIASDLQFDWNLMHNLAVWGGGRFYPALQFSEVPQIFTKETKVLLDARAREQAAREQKARAAAPPTPAPPSAPASPEIPLRLVAAEEPLKGFEREPIPSVDGLLPAAARPSGIAALAAADDRPALVLGRAGLGRTAAWLSDWTDAWGRRWLAWDRFPAFAAQLVRSLQRRGPPNPFPGLVAVEVRSGRARVTVDFREAAERWPGDPIELLADWRQEKGPEHPLPLRRIGPALVEGDFPAPPPGETATVQVKLRHGGREWYATPADVARAYPEELVRAGAESAFPAAAAAGIPAVRLDAVAAPPPAAAPAAGRRSVPLVVPLLIAALLLLPVDIALRRLQF